MLDETTLGALESGANLNNTAKVLKDFGYRAELLKIETDDIYAKTIAGPPLKARKR